MPDFKFVIKLLIGPLVFLLFVILPPLPFVNEAAILINAPFGKAPQIALGGLLWIASWWITEVIPLGLSGIVAAILFSTLGLIQWKDALSSFMDNIIWIFMAGFVLAKAFQVWGLDKRVAFKLSTAYKGTRPFSLRSLLHVYLFSS